MNNSQENTIINPEFIYDMVKKYPLVDGLEDGAARTCDWVYEAISKHISPGNITLETGSGLSTLFFANSPSKRHISIMPYQEEADRLHVTADKIGISLEKVEFLIQSSGSGLPRLNDSIDFILIDGSHGPLMPFVDFYFSVRNLNKGGIVIIDDIQLLAPKVLFEFVSKEPTVEILKSDERAAMLRINDNVFLDYDWGYSAIDYKAENKTIFTDELLATFEKLNPS